jgi:hypothetical protein
MMVAFTVCNLKFSDELPGRNMLGCVSIGPFPFYLMPNSGIGKIDIWGL